MSGFSRTARSVRSVRLQADLASLAADRNDRGGQRRPLASASRAGKSASARSTAAVAATIGLLAATANHARMAFTGLNARIVQTAVAAEDSLRPTSGFAVKRRAQKSAGDRQIGSSLTPKQGKRPFKRHPLCPMCEKR